MAFLSFSYFFIFLLHSTWAGRFHGHKHHHYKPRPFSDSEYPECSKNSSLLRSLPVERHFPKLMITYSISTHHASGMINTFTPFSHKYRNCIWCQLSSTDCIKTSHSSNGDQCTKVTTYLGPPSKLCVLPDKVKNIQMVIERRNLTHFEAINSSVENRWKIIPESNYFPGTTGIKVGGRKDYTIVRRARHVDACSFPDALETASLNCRLYPSSVKCVQRCAFGYTLQGGIKQEMKCLIKENIWRPTGFQECQPFVDCSLVLSSAGHATCTSMSLKTAPSCRVDCLHYEDKDAVPEQTYTCSIDGKWTPPLPFCATSGQGMALTKAPTKKLHDD